MALPERSRTIVFLLEPYAPAVMKPRRDKPHLDAGPARDDRIYTTAVQAPIYGDRTHVAATSVRAPPDAPVSSETSVIPTFNSEPSLVAIPSRSASSASAPLNLGDQVIRSAAAQTKGTSRKLVDISGQQVNTPKPTKNEQFAAGVAEAGVPGCLRPDAFKLDPPAVGSIPLVGILAAPNLVHAILTGKCKL
jgi:hypothetical protein